MDKCIDNKDILVSFCILFRDQKRFVADALKGAFAQTYEPMEIVVSDDGSTDGTWPLVQTMVDEYRKGGGRHKVILNHNDKNLGRLENRLKAFSLSHGELLVNADGDDISCPSRVEQIVSAWRKDGCKAAALVNGAKKISSDGRRVLGLVSEDWAKLTPVGALTTYARCVYDAFLNQPVFVTGGVDDDILGYRTRLLGKVIYVAEPLVLYRTDSGISAGSRGYRRRMVKLMRIWLNDSAQMRKDCDFARTWLDADRRNHEMAELDKSVVRVTRDLELWDGDGFRRRMNAFRQIVVRPMWRPSNLVYLILLLPRGVADLLLDLMRFMQHRIAYLRGECTM